ncbi:di-heme-cytochrome C peroxidase [Bradyrhizobium sp. Cp5.3]|uniref:di-heme-cytochrome C peroxidase n=1 Tax=Bradyrhizobium sp. Cp5.3 TaxID=443598 RepID=UPI0003FA1679|nr:di-heme-cytochrome C peroxidase [Bradyrhizobium sp. Cp5.3]
MSEQVALDQGWNANDADRFHHEAQGTHTLPIPLPWFLALEAPLNSPFAVPFFKRERFADDRYLLRFGFIGSAKSKNNEYGLPIGFAYSPFQSIKGLPRKDTAVGLTCAACHTGQLVFKDKRYIIDGGPAVTDLGQLTFALRAALAQTALSAKLPFFDGRFRRFAKAVLGTEYNDLTRVQLSKELEGILSALIDLPAGIDVTEGFSRLDALNRIGNQVFALDTGRYSNYVNINAPVTYPHIWTSSWFNWVQYDASIMQPLVRNAGEAMGVSAEVNFTAPPNEGRFASSIPFDNLHWIEQQLAGKDQPLVKKAFTGLKAPTWPDGFPAIDKAKAAAGAQLYDKHCSGCHLPALTPDIERGKAPDAKFWEHFGPIRWRGRDGQEKQTAESVLYVEIFEQSHIGTDPAQGSILRNRTVDTAGRELARAGQTSPGLGVDIDVCQLKADKTLDTIHVSDNAMQLFALALGATVQLGINEWMRSTGTNRADVEGDRPNCLAAGFGYKARPLNGVWATAPFLHNGSVPTIYDLLSPVAERPKAFLLGDPSFDPVRLGIVTRTVDPKGKTYDRDGYFILDTSKSANRNTGHEFSNDRREGVIGPALSADERNAIIEFLKSI